MIEPGHHTQSDPDVVRLKAREEMAPGVHELAASAVFVGALLTIAGAWFFELVLGLQPCPLCLTQRIPYYIGVVLAGGTALVAWSNSSAQRGRPPTPWLEARPMLVRTMLALLAVLFLVSAGLGAYHAGVEWRWWAGPSDCSGQDTSPASVDDLLGSLDAVRVVACNEAPWTFLGLSLAGWNAVISLALAAVAARGAWTRSPQTVELAPFHY